MENDKNKVIFEDEIEFSQRYETKVKFWVEKKADDPVAYVQYECPYCRHKVSKQRVDFYIYRNGASPQARARCSQCGYGLYLFSSKHLKEKINKIQHYKDVRNKEI